MTQRYFFRFRCTLFGNSFVPFLAFLWSILSDIIDIVCFYVYFIPGDKTRGRILTLRAHKNVARAKTYENENQRKTALLAPASVLT